MTPADRLAEAAAVAAEKHAEFFILLKSADYTTEEKRALQVPLFNELGVAMRALREELADYRAAPPRCQHQDSQGRHDCDEPPVLCEMHGGKRHWTIAREGGEE